MNEPKVIILRRSGKAVKFCGCGRIIGTEKSRKTNCGRKSCQ